MIEDKTLQELEQITIGQPSYDSYLVTKCHELMSKPLKEFTVEDLRIMIGQGIGLKFLVPRALVVLRQDPLAEGDFYPGDLLSNVLRCPSEFWVENPKLAAEIRVAIQGLTNEIDIEKDLQGLIKKFLHDYANK